MPQANKLKGIEDGLHSMVSQIKDTLYLGNYTWLETRRKWKWLVAVFPFEYSLLVSNFFSGEKYVTIKVHQSRHSAGSLLHMLKNMYSFALLLLCCTELLTSNHVQFPNVSFNLTVRYTTFVCRLMQQLGINNVSHV